MAEIDAAIDRTGRVPADAAALAKLGVRTPWIPFLSTFGYLANPKRVEMHETAGRFHSRNATPDLDETKAAYAIGYPMAMGDYCWHARRVKQPDCF